MKNRKTAVAVAIALTSAFLMTPSPLRADGDITKVNHIIIVMQENHSFDNYFGALPYVPNGAYHRPGLVSEILRLGCSPTDHQCVDGLSCQANASGDISCLNSNLDDIGHLAFAFHDPRRCVLPDLDHSWVGTHKEANFLAPNATTLFAPNNGFVLVNDATEQPDSGGESTTEDQSMAFYNQAEIPFYYDLAQSFAINDRYFASVLGPTFPNRSYLMAATSFGHLTTSDSFPPPGSAGYKPITGTIFDLLDANHVSWANYFQDVPQGGSFRPFSLTGADPHFLPLQVFLLQAAGVPVFGPLPQVSFVDPNFGVLGGPRAENDEHPPTDIQKGQAFVSQVVNTVRNGPNWKDTVIIIVYDEHGGFYDHAKSPLAKQDGKRTPDGIAPGQCADLSNPPASLQPGGGAECSSNLLSATDTTTKNAADLCPAFANDPTGPYPKQCASFDQLGIRVPFIAVSRFAKKGYVSHTIGDHTSLLALIEKRFLPSGSGPLHLTRRDGNANTMEDLFDFDHAPSLNTPVTQAAGPAVDCTP